MRERLNEQFQDSEMIKYLFNLLITNFFMVVFQATIKPKVLFDRFTQAFIPG